METTATLTMDTIEQRLAQGEATIAEMRAAQMVLIREADRRQAPLADGCRSMAEWVTGRLDVAPETAKALVSTARRLEALPTVQHAVGAVGSGAISFDRTTPLSVTTLTDHHSLTRRPASPPRGLKGSPCRSDLNRPVRSRTTALCLIRFLRHAL